MSGKRTRLSNGDKMAILKAIRIPGEPNELDIGFNEPSYVLVVTPRKRKRS